MSRADARHLRLLAFVLLLGVAAAYLVGGLRARPAGGWFGLDGEADYGYRPDPEGFRRSRLVSWLACGQDNLPGHVADQLSRCLWASIGQNFDCCSVC